MCCGKSRKSAFLGLKTRTILHPPPRQGFWLQLRVDLSGSAGCSAPANLTSEQRGRHNHPVFLWYNCYVLAFRAITGRRQPVSGPGETAAVPPPSRIPVRTRLRRRGPGAEAAQQRPLQASTLRRRAGLRPPFFASELLLLFCSPAHRREATTAPALILPYPTPIYQPEVNRLPIVPREWWA